MMMVMVQLCNYISVVRVNTKQAGEYSWTEVVEDEYKNRRGIIKVTGHIVSIRFEASTTNMYLSRPGN